MDRRRLLAAMVLAIAGTVGAVTGSDAQEAEATKVVSPRSDIVTVHVTNYNFNDVNVFLLAGGQRIRLGTVASQGDGEFKLPRWASGSDLRLVADPIGSNRAYVSDLIVAMPGQRVDFTVESRLPHSNVWVS